MSTVTVSRNELGDAITFASLGLPKRPVVPVLGGMRVTVSPGTLELAAFDYETAARVKVPVQASGPAETLVTGAELAAAVKSLPRGRKVTAELHFSEAGITITCDGIESVVPAMPAEAVAEYPQLPALPAESGLIDGAMFARSVARVAACAGTDDTLPVLTCVNMTSDAGSLEMAATDRYRLGVDRLHWTGADGISAVVPAVILARYAKAADKSGKVSVHLAEGFAGFSDGVRTLITHTNPGEFPRYHALMRPADDNDTTVLADAKSLHDAVARAGKLTERNRPIGFDVAGGRITITASRDGQVVGTQHVAAEFDGPEQSYKFNAGFLASVLAGFDGPAWLGLKTKTTTTDTRDGKEVTSQSQQPVLIWGDGDTFTALCMHIRLAG
jgi:DNA polymerase-3 subunit beta